VNAELFKPLSQEVRTTIKNWYGVPHDGKVVLFVGRLTRLKGVHLIVDAVERLRRIRSDIVLLVAGNGDEERALHEQVRTADLESCVRLLGKVPQEELPALYNIADLTVVASEQESLCFTILESLACGTPVASTRVGVAPYVIEDERSGVLLEQRTVDEIIRGIAAGLELPAELRQECVRLASSLNQASGTICDLIGSLGRRR
jgi:glycosyltransferase involved in cell wall biosynthesis